MSTYSPNLRIELIDSGTQAGVWGTTTNTNLGTLIEQSISGYVSVSITAASQALTAVNGATDQSRMAMVRLTTTTTAAFSVFVPPSAKQYTFKNSSGYTATIYCSTVLGNTTIGGTGIVVPNGAIISVWSDGANISLQNQNSVTPTAGTNNTQVATTAFVQAALQAIYPIGTIYTSTVATNPAATFGFGVWSTYGGGKVLVGYLAGDPLFGTGGGLNGFADTPIVSHTHVITLTNTTHTHSVSTVANGDHQHFIASDISSGGSNVTAGTTATRQKDDAGDSNYRLIGLANAATVGLTSTAGSHTHSMTVGNNTATPTASSAQPVGNIAGTNRNYQPSITVYMWKRDS
jgi:hypothetical protein